MDRLIGLVVVLLLVVVALPIVAGYAAGAVPALLSLLVFLGVLRLFLPARSRRRS
jgi:hypothetical protein